MSKMLDIFKQVIDSRGWQYDTGSDPEDNTEMIAFGLKCEYNSMFVVITDQPEEERLMIRCRLKDHVPEKQYALALGLINDMNYHRWITRASIDRDDCELVFSHTVLYAGLRFTRKAAESTLDRAIEVADFETHNFFEVLGKAARKAGISPETASAPMADGSGDDSWLSDTDDDVAVEVCFRWSGSRSDN